MDKNYWTYSAELEGSGSHIERPLLSFTNEADGLDIEIKFGFYKNEPMAQLWHENKLVLIPKEVLQIASEQGWDTDCPHCLENEGE